MKERIFLAPGAANSDMIRSMAKAGVSSIGIRIVNAVELARIALMRSGVSLSEEYITRSQEAAVIFSFLSSIDYFRSASYADAENLARALNTARSLIADAGDEDMQLKESAELKDVLDKGEFQDKNQAIFQAYSSYMKALKGEGRIDSVSLIRKAINHADKLKSEIVILDEFPLSPLERKLADSLSEGKATEISIRDLFKAKPPTAVAAITDAYGAINEVEDILTYILENEIPLDQCLIACANTKAYSQLFLDMAREYKIPVSFGTGLPISNSYPAKLLEYLKRWDSTGFNGITALRELLRCEALDRKTLAGALGLGDRIDRRTEDKLTEMAGNLRISFDEIRNRQVIDTYRPVCHNKEILELTEKLAEELGKGIIEFLEKYTLIRQDAEGRLDKSALQAITGFLDNYLAYEDQSTVASVIPKIMDMTVNSEMSRAGYLHITGIRGAMSSMRENLFVCGLSAAEFPGSPRENYLLLDSDLEAFDIADKSQLPTSDNLVTANIRSLDNLLKLAADLGSRVRLSYSGYDLADLKEKNPSSVLFAYMAKEETELRKVRFFDGGLSPSRLVGHAYSMGGGFEQKQEEILLPEEGELDGLLDIPWSPSALDIFFQCPRRFYLKYVRRLPEEEADDPLEIIGAAPLGTMAHSMMEHLAQQEADGSISKEKFISECRQAFEEYLLGRPPLHDPGKEKWEFLRMMGKAYEADPHNRVLSAETEYTYRHPQGVILHGYPDRVEEDSEGKYLIADFKTMRRIQHQENDIETCLQVVIYAWLCRQAGIDIDRCEYRYLRKGMKVSCRYDSRIEASLDSIIGSFREAVEAGDFPANKSDDNCRYCKYSQVCRWGDDHE